MKKSLLISTIFILVVLVALVFALNNKADAPVVDKQSGSSKSNMSSGSVDGGTGSTQPSDAAGKYVEYSNDILAEVDGEKILFFHASWCPQCRSIEKGILEQGVPTGLVIIKVDYDKNQELRQRYGVTLQTTFVKIDGQGNEINKHVAYNEPTFEAVKRDFLRL